jgi:TolB-like protein/class 3 adenylate cyclase/Tfp pilus assembly protein PilF
LATELMERRLVAVLAADVVGYSRLMGIDEEGTLVRLKAVRKALVDPAIASHRGRIVKTTGDGMLVEFVSAVDAARCAVAVQREVAGQNVNVPHELQIEFRIGIHVGDIIIDENDIFGDGVNIAARLEGIADPGGVCISDDTHRQIRGKVDIAFDDMGSQTLKNITEPMRAWRMRVDNDTSSTFVKDASAASVKVLALPDKPSIAVLPFQNMSGDPEQEYFTDGMVEDIITALSQFKSLFVIARNSSFTYKGKPVAIKQVGYELGVRYVLEGSVRKSGNRVRITGQLIEAATGAYLWAEKIDGELEGVFDLQDEVTARVVGAIEPSITQAEIHRAREKPTRSLDAYDCYLRALFSYYRLTREGSDVAVDYLQQAIARDPGYALAKAFLAFNYVARWVQGWSEAGDMGKGMALAREAIADGPNEPSVLRLAGHTLSFWGDHDRGLAVLEKAARLNVNGSQVLDSLGWVLVYACIELDRAILQFERAIRLSPRDPEIGLMLNGIALAHLIAGRATQALTAAQKGIDDLPRFTSVHRIKIAALVGLGRLQDAKTAAETFLSLDPTFTITTRLPKFRDVAFQQRYHSALKAAGLPE